VLETADVVAFLPSLDLERSERFFHGVLGLTPLSRSPYATVFRAGHGTLRVTKVDDLEPQPFTVVGWVVGDARAEVALLRERGLRFLRYEGMGQDDDDIWTTPGGDLIVWFHDPDRNVLSLTQLVTMPGSPDG